MRNRNAIEKLTQLYDSFYLYDQKVIEEKMCYLKENFPGVKFLYSMKCNPENNVLQTIFDGGFGADAASLGEVLKAHELGLAKNEIYYSAPGKMKKDIEIALDKSVIIVDSIEEIYRIEEIATDLDKVVSVGVRINPNFTLSGDVCQFNKFGVDEEQVDAYLGGVQCPHIKVTGIHVHLKSQELDTAAMERYYKKVFQLASKYDKLTGGLEYVNLGSGLGVEYAFEDQPIDVEYLGNVVKAEMKAYAKENPKTHIMIETGRYITCKSGVYVTKVVDKKVSCGKKILILKNTLNGFCRPSFEQMFTRCGGIDTAPVEPLFTRNGAFQLETMNENAETEVVTIYGNLCTGNDLVATDVELPRLDCGDIIVINNAGSYAAVISPMQFSSQEKPKELFLTTEGDVLY